VPKDNSLGSKVEPRKYEPSCSRPYQCHICVVMEDKKMGVFL